MKSGDISKVNVVKVLSATMVQQRETLGEKVTEWLAQHPRYELLDIVVTQSSDHQFHCVAVTVFAHDPDAAARVIGAPKAASVVGVSKAPTGARK